MVSEPSLLESSWGLQAQKPRLPGEGYIGNSLRYIQKEVGITRRPREV